MKIGMVAGTLLSAVVCLSSAAAWAEEPNAKQSEPQEYLLRYKFHAGDTLRWTVVNRCRVRTTVTTSTQTAETTTTSVKVWRVHEVNAGRLGRFRSLGGKRRYAAPPQRSRRGPLQQPHRSLRSPWFRRRGPGDRRTFGHGDDRQSGQGPAAEAKLRQGRGGRAGRDHDSTARPGRGRRRPLVEPEQYRRSTPRRQRCGDSSPCKATNWKA